jgi:sugar phosphate isomerase/epimerase
LERVIPFVASMHLKDTDGGFKSGKFPVLGQGVVDFPRIFKTLADAHFDGPLTMELEGDLMKGLNLDQRQEKVAACVAYLKTIGVV